VALGVPVGEGEGWYWLHWGGGIEVGGGPAWPHREPRGADDDRGRRVNGAACPDPHRIRLYQRYIHMGDDSIRSGRTICATSTPENDWSTPPVTPLVVEKREEQE
jgi:hypothetical protein